MNEKILKKELPETDNRLEDHLLESAELALDSAAEISEALTNPNSEVAQPEFNRLRHLLHDQTTKFLKIIYRLSPHSSKRLLKTSLEGSDILFAAYVDSIEDEDPDFQMMSVLDITLEKLTSEISSCTQMPSKSKLNKIHKNGLKLRYALSKAKDSYTVGARFARILHDNSGWWSVDGEMRSEAKSIFISALLENFGKLDTFQSNNIATTLFKESTPLFQEFILSTPAEMRKRLSVELFSSNSFDPLQNVEKILWLLRQNIDVAEELVNVLLKSITSGDARNDEEGARTIRLYTDVVPKEKHVSFDDTIVTRANSLPFSKRDGTLQLRQIEIISDDPELQSRIFSALHSWELDYSEYDGKIDLAVLITTVRNPHLYLSNFDRLIQSGKLPKNRLPEVAEKLIRNIINTFKAMNMREIIVYAQRYDVPIDRFSDLFLTRATADIKEGFLSDDLAEASRHFPDVVLETPYEDFDLDLQSDPSYGELTWRPIQSLIDFLQNHLDAQDYEYAMRLADAAYSDKERRRDGSFSNNLLTDVIEFKRRLPFPEGYLPKSGEVPVEYLYNVKDLVDRIESIDEPAPPLIELLYSVGENEQMWMSLDEADESNQTGQLLGFRFTDFGIGYEKSLNSLYNPTKSELPFLRGKYGQGVKMSMIGLAREGCDVTVSSRMRVSGSAEIAEWEGSPKYSQETQSVHFQGKERRLLNGQNAGKTGTVTTVMIRDVVSKEFRNNLESTFGGGKQREKLGEYILDYHPLKHTFKKGGTAHRAALSFDPTFANKLYVKGLEVPNQTFGEFAFGYNFLNRDLINGRDRKYLKPRETEEAVELTWASITDVSQIKDFYSFILGRSERKIEKFKEPFERMKMLQRLHALMSPEVRDIHKSVISDMLGYSGNQKILIYYTSDTISNSDELLRLKQEGYTSQVELTGSGDSLGTFLNELLGYDSMVVLEKLLRSEKGKISGEKMELSPELKEELEALVDKTKKTAVSMLKDQGQLAPAEQLENAKTETIFSYNDSRQRARLFQTNPRFDNTGGRWSVSGYAVTLFLETIAEKPGTPEELTTSQKLLLSQRLLPDLIIFAMKLGHNSENSLDACHLAQDFANDWLKASAKCLNEEQFDFARLQLGDTDALTTVEAKNLHKMPGLESLVLVREILLKELKPGCNRETLIMVVNAINQCASVHPEVITSLESLLSNLQFFDGPILVDGEIIKFKHNWGSSDRLMEIQIVSSSLVGEVNSSPVYKFKPSYDLTALLIPFDFSSNKIANLKIGGKTVHVPSGRSASDVKTVRSLNALQSPELYFSESDPSGSSLLESTIYTTNNAVVIPVGFGSDDKADDRIQFFLKNANFRLNSEDTVQRQEQRRGAEFISTNASQEYGRGSIWDDPVRIFGDVIQNHLDAGNVKVSYKLDGAEGYVTSEQLLESQFANKKIVAIRVEDDGEGFTTKGLSNWGDPTKKGGGKKGRFGEGLKMLSASCVRNGLIMVSSSRDWEARATKQEREMIVNGSRSRVNIVGFDMKWLDEIRTGSSTEISVVPKDTGDGYYDNWIWEDWMKVMDPRNGTDMLGNRGINRFVKEIRPTKGKEIKAGKVTFLLEETGGIFERGLLVPNAQDSLGTNFLCGLDIDDEVISSQERNILEKDKLIRLIEEAFKIAPYELIKFIFESLKSRLYPVAKTIDFENQLKTNFEFSPFSELDYLGLVNDAVVAKAFLDTFGASSIISSKSASLRILETGSFFNPETHQHETATEKELEIAKATLIFEEKNFSKDSVIDLGPKCTVLTNQLSKNIESVGGVVKAMAERPVVLIESEHETLQRGIRLVAEDMLAQFKRLAQIKGGQELLNHLMNDPERHKPKIGKLELNLSDIEYALTFLELVSTGVLQIDARVIGSVSGLGGYVSTATRITYPSTTLNDKSLFDAVTKHELAHLAFQTSDYNSVFVYLLLLSNEAFLTHLQYLDN